MNTKIVGLAIMFLSATLLATPVLAIGPKNGNGNPIAITVILDNGNKVTEIWLPSGVMNEWINTGIPHTSGRVHILDAAKAGIKNAAVAVSPFDLFLAENKWFYYTSEQLGELLAYFGLDSTRADAYTQGLYIRLNVVG